MPFWSDAKIPDVATELESKLIELNALYVRGALNVRNARYKFYISYLDPTSEDEFFDLLVRYYLDPTRTRPSGFCSNVSINNISYFRYGAHLVKFQSKVELDQAQEVFNSANTPIELSPINYHDRFFAAIGTSDSVGNLLTEDQIRSRFNPLKIRFRIAPSDANLYYSYSNTTPYLFYPRWDA